MIAFIDEHRAVHGVEPICKVLPIAPSTYHAHAACRTDPKRASARARSDAAVSREIQRVWDENFQVYGIRKVWRQLKREGIEVARCTVALDSESEKQVQEAIEHLCQNRTTIVIAHRLHTIMHADAILVVEGGEIVERGRHDDLLRRGGRYASFFRLQHRDAGPLTLAPVTATA